MDNEIKLLEPITVEFKGIGKKQFRTVDAILRWAEEERRGLEKLRNLIANANAVKADRLVDDMRNYIIQQVIGQAQHALAQGEGENQRTAFNEIRNALRRYEDTGSKNKFVSVKSPQVRQIWEDHNADPDIAAVVLAKARDRRIANAEISSIPHFVYAVVGSETQTTALKRAVAGQEKALQDLRSEWEATFEGLRMDLTSTLAAGKSDHRKAKKQGRRMMRTWVRARRRHAARMSAIEKAFSTEMQLRAAERYWSVRRKRHEQKAKTSLKTFFGWTAGAVLFLLLLYAGIHYLALPKVTGLNAAALFAYGLPTALVLWGLRILAGIYRENRDIADDAAERVAMVMTFKALEYDERVSDQERLVILNTLFRPHTRGPEDAMPHAVWESMIKRLNPTKSS